TETRYGSSRNHRKRRRDHARFLLLSAIPVKAGIQARKRPQQFPVQRHLRRLTVMRFQMSAKIQVIFYSMYGHVYQMAEAVAAGARKAGAGEVSLWQVPELVPDEILEKSGANIARAAFADVPVAKPTQLGEAYANSF